MSCVREIKIFFVGWMTGWKVKTALILCMATQHESFLLIRKSTKEKNNF